MVSRVCRLLPETSGETPKICIAAFFISHFCYKLKKLVGRQKNNTTSDAPFKRFQMMKELDIQSVSFR